MKTITFYSVIAAAVIALTSFAPFAQAQTTKVKAEVPFVFECNGHTFASGTYSMSVRPDGVVEIGRGRHVQTSLAQAASLASTPTASTIVFHRAGEKYYLRQISIAGSSRQLNFMESRGERRTQSAEIAANETATVEIVAEASR